MDRNYTPDDVMEPMSRDMQQEDKFAHVDIDELLSRCVLAFKEERLEDYQECRAQLLNRIHTVREAQRKLKGVFL